jgi:hypothetical protein
VANGTLKRTPLACISIAERHYRQRHIYLLTMNDFKFKCPKCGQSILANALWIGKVLNCPSCDTRIPVCAPEKPVKQKQKQKPPVVSTVSGPKVSAKSAPVRPQAEAKGMLKKEVTSRATKKVTVTKKPASKPAEQAEPAPDARHTAVLSAAVKLDIVRAVRQRISAESAWLPGRVDGKTAYAAKMEGGKPVLLAAKDPEATRFSLMGAFVLILHLHRVVATATGRKRFLDKEIPDAIGEVLLEQMDDAQREDSENALANQDLLAISHAQCLAVLNAMEARYAQRVEQRRIEKAKKQLGNVRLTDLVKKLEKKARIPREDIATALYHEITEVQRRLERLENRGNIGE